MENVEIELLKKELVELRKQIEEIKEERQKDKIEMKIKTKLKLDWSDEIKMNELNVKEIPDDIFDAIRTNSSFNEGWNQNYYLKTNSLFGFNSNAQIMKISTPFVLNKNYQLVKIEDGKYQILNSCIQYYEVELKGNKIMVSIGIVENEHRNKTHHVGWDLGSIGFHSDDGKLFNQNAKGEEFDKPYNEGDIIGCGYIPSTKTIFYTRNGNLVKMIPNEVLMNHFAIGLESYESVLINTGKKPFKFDLIGFNNQFTNKEGEYYKTFTVNCDLFIFEMKMNLFATLKEIKEILIEVLQNRIASNEKLSIKEKYYDLEEMYWNESIVDTEEVDNVINLRNRIAYNGWYDCSLIGNVLKTTNQIEMKFQTHKQQREIEEKRREEIRRQPQFFEREEVLMKKPVILLYDNKIKEKEEVKINLKLNDAMDIGTTHPKPEIIKEEMKQKEYEWEGTYSSDGINNCIINIDNKQFDYIFWEGICLKNDEFKGEVIGISNINLTNELHDLLIKLGLNERETNDFIVYWLPPLSKRRNHKITICDSSYDNEIAPLSTSGFDQIHRVMLKFEEAESIDELTTIQSIQQRNRPFGKYVIEWGAILA